MLLRQIAENDNYNCGENFSDGRIKMHVLNQNIQDGIIKKEIDGHNQPVSEKLNSSFQVGAGKNNILRQEKTQRKGYTKSHDQCRIVCFDDDKTQIERLLLQDKIKADKKQKDIQYLITTAADRVPKGLQWEYPLKWRIKKIYELKRFFAYGF